MKIRMSLCLTLLLVIPSVWCAAHESATAQTNSQVFIRVNQIGYGPREPKSAIALSRAPLPARFQLFDPATQQIVFEGISKPLIGAWGEFTQLVELNFSSFQRSGKYFLQLGEARSPSFEIGAANYASFPDQLLEFMRQQRCGYNPFVDAVCHSFDGRTAFGPLAAGTYIDARGGWHDAGDQLKYLLTASNATAQMLLAYELRPREFQDRFNSFGQPGANGPGDVLDE